MRSYMKVLSLVLATTAALAIVPQLAAQCTPQFNISVFSDGDSNTDNTMIYGYSSTDDSSTLCTCVHSNYQTTAYLELADGSYVSNTDAGETSSVQSATDGDGSYYALGVVTLNCSCVGSLGGGGGKTPIPFISGIADSYTWSNTIYQGTSGYLAIFGTDLTGGGAYSPTVTGDGDVTVSPYWNSDTQVNVSYTVSAYAAIGPHTIVLATPQGQAQGPVQVAPALQITRSNDLWFFGIGNTPPATFQMGDIQTTLTLGAAVANSYTWTITNGAAKASFASGVAQSSITTAGNSVTLYSISFGTQLLDVTVSVSWGNGNSVQTSLTIDSPYSLAQQNVIGPGAVSACAPNFPAGGTGWHTQYTWLILSKFGKSIAGQNVNENFDNPQDAQPNNWGGFNPNGSAGVANSTTFKDDYCLVGIGGVNPNTQAPQNPLGANLVDSVTQIYSIGSTTVGSGVPVQDQTLSRYVDHPALTNIVSPVRGQ